VTAVSDATGALVNANSYDEYGVPNPTNIGRFGYTGQAWIPEVGLYYYKARFYSPNLGVFLQADPIGYGDGMNMYAYVHGDPINGTDPTGMDGIPDIGAVTEFDGNAFAGVTGIRVCLCAPIAAYDSGIFGRGASSGGQGNLQRAPVPPAPPPPPRAAAPQSNACHSPATSPQELAAAKSGNRLAYWQSRAARGDPLGQTALSIVNNQGLGAYANGRLFAALSEGPDSDKGMAGIQADIQSIGVALMQQNVAYTAQVQGNVTPAGVAGYHAGVFGAFGIPASTFGGAPFTGSGAEATMTSPIWFHC
jgi:RHS repeat-associated protein